MTAKPFDWSGKIAPASLPPELRNRAEVIEKITRALDRTQWHDREAIETAQRAQLQKLAKHFERVSPAFRDKLLEAGLQPDDFESADALRRLPLLSRRELQQPGDVPERLLPAGHAPVETNRTSGSTGEPVTVRRTAVNATMWSAQTMREVLWHNMPLDGRMSVIRATNEVYAELRDWGAPINLLFKTGPAQLIPITADIAQQIAWLEEFHPDILIVYPSVLEAIEAECRRKGTALPDLQLIWTVGEMLPTRTREAAAKTFGARIVDNYSSQEVGIIALQCPDSDLYHVMDESLIVEAIDDSGRICGPGETGRAVITDLQNYATALFRYDIGDYVEVAEPCPCGRGLHTLRRVAGRARNLIVMPDGTRHWPLVGFARFREVAPVVQYQLVQDRPESIEVRLVTERKLTADEESALGDVIRTALGHPFDLRFAYFSEKLPKGANGKFEEFVSKL